MKTICRKICKLDEKDQYCVGCGRTTDEIREWYTADLKRKKEIAIDARERLTLNNLTILDGDYYYMEFD